jgi:DNA-binding transcriptional regulator LsrR (DeoR family)
MLKRARDAKIVRISVTTLAGFSPDLEDALKSRFLLRQAIVIDSDGEEERVVRDLGAAAAFHVETTIRPGMIIGISSWSRSLFALVDTLHPSLATCANPHEVPRLPANFNNPLRG